MNQIGLFIIRILSFLPLWVLRLFALKTYNLLRLFRYRKSVIAQNLNKSFPNKSTQEKKTYYQVFLLALLLSF